VKETLEKLNYGPLEPVFRESEWRQHAPRIGGLGYVLKLKIVIEINRM
jgi:hypothetical protein